MVSGRMGASLRLRLQREEEEAARDDVVDLAVNGPANITLYAMSNKFIIDGTINGWIISRAYYKTWPLIGSTQCSAAR